MQLNTSDVIDSFKKQGLRLTVVSIVSALVLGIIDQFTAKIIPTAVEKIEYLVDPPKFFVDFGNRVDLSEGLVISALSAEAALAIKYNAINDRVIAALAGPGVYTLRLRRKHGQVPQELVSTKAIEKSNAIWQIDLAEHNWANASELKGSAALPLAETRWSAAEPDFAVAATVQDPVMRSMLATALAEVGVFADGSDRDRSRVLSYWQPFPGFDNLSGLPWSGAFIGWVVKQAGAEPPAGGARNASWRQWGDKVATAEMTAGMVAVFAPASASAGSGLVGIVLRRQPQCIEVVMGNVAHRVVISCVAASKLVAVQRPSAFQSTDKGAASAPAAPKGE